MAHVLLYRRIAVGLLFAAGGLVLLLAYRQSAAPCLVPQTPCMLLEFTGLQCPLCGGQGAVHALLHGHWGVAWQRHPGIALSPVLAMLGLGVHRALGRPGVRVWGGATVVALIGFTIVRNLP